MKVIWNRKAQTAKSQVKVLVILFLVLMCFIALTSHWKVTAVAAGFFAASMFVILIFDNSWTGWRITKSSITLLRHSIIGLPSEQKIPFSEIQRMMYCNTWGTKKPDYQGLRIWTKGETFLLTGFGKPFEMAATLKHLYDSGLNLEFEQRDHEVQLYITGKINHLPMNNE